MRKEYLIPAAEKGFSTLGWGLAGLVAALLTAASLPVLGSPGAPVRVSVEASRHQVRVHVRGLAPLPRHYLRSVPGTDDVSLWIPGCTAGTRTMRVAQGGVEEVVVRPSASGVSVVVRRVAATPYRSCYTNGRREIVLEVDKAVHTTAATTPPAGREALEEATTPAPRRDELPPVRAQEPAKPASPAAAVPEASVLSVVDRVPGVWRVLGSAQPVEKRVTLDFVGAEIQDVLKALALQSGTNILVAPKVEGKVTLHLRNVTPEKALEYVVRLSGLAYGREENTYVVCPRDDVAVIFPPGSGGEVLFPRPAPPTDERAVPPTAAPPKVELVRTRRLPVEGALPLLARIVPEVQTQVLEPNALVLVGPEAALQTARETVQALDAAIPEGAAPAPPTEAPVLTPEELEIMPHTLRHVSAVDAGRILEGLMQTGVLPRVVVTPAPAPTFPAVTEKGVEAAKAAPRVTPDPAKALLNLLTGARATQTGAAPEKPG
ncbi:MAG: secretin and TonB N-terminal domain-containing protein, partial [Armatimonadota bacterium]|nr:secretin and TonB N-terminal domain-containing protein [Armatimonadota bacterium]